MVYAWTVIHLETELYLLPIPKPRTHPSGRTLHMLQHQAMPLSDYWTTQRRGIFDWQVRHCDLLVTLEWASTKNASTLKGKNPTVQDWWLHGCYEAREGLPSKQALVELRLPFKLWPETSAHIPKEYFLEVNYLAATPGPLIVPWNRYYINYNGANFVVSNTFGLWFEIRKWEGTWEAFWLARVAFKLTSWAIEGIDHNRLVAIGEDLPKSRAPTPADLDYHSEQKTGQVPIQVGGLSSYTPRALPSKKPHQKKG